jgi:hypothetical protein
MDQLSVRRAENAPQQRIVLPGTWTIYVELAAMPLQQSLIRVIRVLTALIGVVSQPFSWYTPTHGHLQSSQCTVTGHALRHGPADDLARKLGHWAKKTMPWPRILNQDRVGATMAAPLTWPVLSACFAALPWNRLPAARSRREVFAHCVQEHEIHHRGEIYLMLGLMGMEAPDV